jgi:hypothetical protein
MSEFTIEYGDILKAYQSKVSEILNQLITAEAKLIASVNYINKLQEQIKELELENAKYQKTLGKTSTKKTSTATENIVDYN